MTPSGDLLHELYKCIIDNGCTPYVLVNTEISDVIVPRAHARDGKVVLNMSPSAIISLRMESDAISFSTRFGGQEFGIYIPIGAVCALYGREDGHGGFFGSGEDEPLVKPTAKPTGLRVVK